MMNNIVGNMIRTKRKELHLTQAELAELINSDAYYISRIETGKQKPGSKFLVALSNALNLPTDYFLGTESNIVLHTHVTRLEDKLALLSPNDRELIITTMETLIDRLSS